MGLFDKKVCDFCGNGIGLLGNRKLADGNMCKDCASRISPFLEGRKEFTVAEMAEHLAYRDANLERLRGFIITTAIGRNKKVYFDMQQCQWFVTSYDNYIAQNVDVFDFAQVTGCQIEIQDHRSEVYFNGPDGHRVPFNPPEYDYDYDVWVRVYVQCPFTNMIEFKVNDFRIEDADSYEYYEAKTYADNIKYVFDQIVGGYTEITVPAEFYMDPSEVERLKRERDVRIRRREELMRRGPVPVGPEPRPVAAAPHGRPAPGPAAPHGRPAPGPAAPHGKPAPGPAAPHGRPAPSPAAPHGRPAPSPAAPHGRPAPSPAAPHGRPAPGPAAPHGRPAPGSAAPHGGSRPGGPRPGGPRPSGPRS